MAIKDSDNEVTVRRLGDVITGTWGKVKELAVSDVSWDSTNNKLTATKNGTTSDVVTKSNLQSALGGTISDGNTGFVTGDAVYDKLALKANLASPTFTGEPKAPTATAGTNTTQIATTAFVKTAVDNAIATADALTYKGTIDGGSTGDYGALTPAASKGDVRKVSAAGKIDGVKVEVGDMLVCNTDNTAAATSSNYSTIVAKWDFIQTNIDGAVSSSSTSVTTNTVAIFDGTTGKIIKSSGYTIGKSVPSNAVFTDTKVTSVENHYTPATDSSAEKDASGGTATQLPTTNGSSNVQVVTGITMDSKGHVTGVVSKGLYSNDTTYESKAEASGGSTVSLCTTGEKYTWNHKQDLISDLSTIRAQAGGAVRYDASQSLNDTQKEQARSNIGAGTSNLALGTDASTAAAGNHTHDASIASDSSSSGVTTLSANTQYKLTAGGSSVVFKTPANPTVNNAALKIQINGGTATSKFTANASSDATLTFATGGNNGTIKVDGTEVAVKGLGSAAYTASTAYATSGHTHDIDLATDSGTATVTLAHNTTYKLTAGGKSVIFKTPTDNNSDTNVTQTLVAADNTSTYPILLAPTGQTATVTTTANFVTGATYKPSTNTLTVNVSGSSTSCSGNAATASAAASGSALETAINSKAASSHSHGNVTSGGAITATAVDIANGDALTIVDSSASGKLVKSSITFDGSTTTKCLTQKGTWATFGTSNLTIGTTDSTAAAGNHTHATTIATSTGTNQITLAASTKYAITAGGTSYVFTTPPNTTYSSKTAALGGTDVSLCTTGEKFTWNSKQDALTEMTREEVADLLASLT